MTHREGARRFLSKFLLAAGVGLCAAVLLHYGRGWKAQRSAGELFAKARENPGILWASLGQEGVAQGYPFGEPLARLRIPAVRINFYVFAGTDEATLEKGPGHVPGTAMPGQDDPRNNCVITGHRDSHFRRLGWLRVGHAIDIETPSGEQNYRVVSREIVDPDAVRVLRPTKKPRLTLITCYPFDYIGPAPKRLVVVAEP